MSGIEEDARRRAEALLLDIYDNDKADDLALLTRALIEAATLNWRPVSEARDGDEGVFAVAEADGQGRFNLGIWRDDGQTHAIQYGETIGQVTHFLKLPPLAEDGP